MNAVATQRRPAAGPDADNGARFLRILVGSRLIRRHAELLGWLDQAQEYLPHQMLLAAWGDFERWNVKWELISHLGRPRVALARACARDSLLRESYAHWLRGRREPLVTIGGALPPLRNPCGCALHGAVRGMQPVLIHGVRDKLSGCDSLYIALDARSLPAPRERAEFIALAHVLFCQLDIVWRRLAACRLDSVPAASPLLLPRDLSAREREILACLARGNTNHAIAESLAISLFTVKNHVKRIFRKIGVSNRTQAAARFNEAMQSATSAGS